MKEVPVRSFAIHPSALILHPFQLTGAHKMVDLIPSSETVMEILKRTGAFREGHFVYPNGKHSPHYFQMPLAFRYYDTARVALNAEQIYCAEQENGKRMFRQYINKGEVNPCIVVDDIIRSGQAIEETAALVKELGANVIGCGAIVRFASAPDKVGDVPIRSLVEFDAHMYESGDACEDCKQSAPVEHVRF